MPENDDIQARKDKVSGWLNDKRIRMIIMCVALALMMLMCVYFLYNADKIMSNPCLTCEKELGMTCVKLGMPTFG